MIRLDIRTGTRGYRHQLDRTRRLLDRVLADRTAGYVVDYQDDVWMFFQNCWHLKDWVMHDPHVRPEIKDRIKAAVHASTVLAVCNDMANGTKHSVLYAPQVGAAHSHLTLATRAVQGPAIDCIIDTDAGPRSAREGAQECLEEWVRILSAEGLATEPLST